MGMYSVEDGKIVGYDHRYQSFYYNTIFRDYNSSIIGQEITGGIIPGSEASDATFSYNGCLGTIQSNQSDYILNFVSHPIIGNNLSMGGLYGGTTSIIVSAYDPQVDPKEVSILASVLSSTSTPIKLLLLASLVLFYLILLTLFSKELLKMKIHRTKRKKSKKTSSTIICFYIVYGCLFKNYSIFESFLTKKRTRIRGILLLLVILTFLFMHYVCSLIKTDQVVYPEPKTITSYQDILDSNGKTVPTFTAMRDDYFSFKFSREGSKRKEIWNRISRGNEVKDSSLLKTKQDFMNLYTGLSNHSMVYLGNTNIQRCIMTNTCYIFKLKGKPHNVLVSIDPKESLMIVKSTMKRRITENEGNVNRFNRVDDILNAFLEMGLHEKAIHEYHSFTMLGGKPFPKQLRHQINVCLSNVIQTPHPEFTNKKMKEFASLFIYFIIAMSACTLVLLIEIIIKEIRIEVLKIIDKILIYQ